MATDISKLGVKTKWQDLTEGMLPEQELQRISTPVSGQA